jgi:hypothetical protein
LHKTKVEMIQSGTLSHPYYWAGFILSGKSDTVVFSQKWKTALAFLAALLVVTSAGVLVRKRFRKKPASLR